MEEKNKPETPRCEFKGAAPHPAMPAFVSIWNLPSGPVVKWSCADHRFSFGGNRSYAVTKFETFANNQPSHPLPDTPEETEDEERTFCESDDESTACVDLECGNPAPYKGAWCDSCQSRWEDEQRGKALREGRFINMRRGF